MHPILKAVKLWCLLGCEPQASRVSRPQNDCSHSVPSQVRPHYSRWTTHGKEQYVRCNAGMKNFLLTQEDPSVREVQSHLKAPVLKAVVIMKKSQSILILKEIKMKRITS